MASSDNFFKNPLDKLRRSVYTKQVLQQKVNMDD